jgi:hypothetical protein
MRKFLLLVYTFPFHLNLVFHFQFYKLMIDHFSFWNSQTLLALELYILTIVTLLQRLWVTLGNGM